MKAAELCAVAVALMATVGWALAAPDIGHYEVHDDKRVCLKAQAALQLLVNNTNGLGFQKFDINPNVTNASGACLSSTSTLKLHFKEGYVMFTFIKVNKSAILDSITAKLTLTPAGHVYNDTFNLKIPLAPSNESFECHSRNTVVLGMALSLVATDVQVQPFGIANGTFSPGARCSEDVTIPTTQPTPPHNHTTHTPKPTKSPAPPTHHPTHHPTHRPTHPPTHPPPSPPSTPSKGNYSISQDNHTCLIAVLALRFNVEYMSQSTKQVAHGIFNVDPNNTKATGSCDPISPMLHLKYPQGYLNFTFAKNESKFYLHKLEGLLQQAFPDAAPQDKYMGANDSLKLFQATVGNSYACMAEQYAVLNSTVNHTVRVVISQVQLQPFNVTGYNLSTAEKCSQDTDNMLIPIIVGSVLAALVLVVLVAYIIGRRRSHSGYQSI